MEPRRHETQRASEGDRARYVGQTVIRNRVEEHQLLVFGYGRSALHSAGWDGIGP